ncbi:MAG: DoxX-like family protein [Alphaproteobacteria bacterium]
MRVVVTGAYGLIGAQVVAHLRARGDEVVGSGRDIATAARRFVGMEWVAIDLARAPQSAWEAVLGGADAVVNCAGALQDGPRDDLEALHVEGVRRLVAACRTRGVRRFVHVSAAGVVPEGTTAFNRTKLAAEAAIRATELDWVILRPGFVLAPVAYGGSGLLRGLAGFPFLTPLVHAESVVQVVSAHDLAEAVGRALAPDAPARITVDLVHGEETTLGAIVPEIRRWLGLPHAPTLHLPGAVARLSAGVADALARLGWRSPMRRTTLEQLRMGVRGDGGAAGRLLGLRLASLREILDRWPAGVQERWYARLYFLKPAVLVGLGLFWLLSGLIGLMRVLEATAILTAAGVAPLAATAAVVGGAAVDIALAVALAVRRRARAALVGMIVVSAGYLFGGTLLRPDLWADPLGPFLKIVPAALLAAAALATLDER